MKGIVDLDIDQTSIDKYNKKALLHEMNPKRRTQVNDFLFPLWEECRQDIDLFISNIDRSGSIDILGQDMILDDADASDTDYDLLRITDEDGNRLVYPDG